MEMIRTPATPRFSMAGILCPVCGAKPKTINVEETRLIDDDVSRGRRGKKLFFFGQDG
jgi:hypothetical protein